MTDTDLYELLGVGRDATDDELKRAYRAKAREFHPDTNQAGSEDDEHFKEISLAYEVLRDPERRARYDRFGHAGVFGQARRRRRRRRPVRRRRARRPVRRLLQRHGRGPGRRGRRTGPVPGPDAELVVELTFREAVFGVQRQVDVTVPVHCDTCEGSGAQPGHRR